MSESIHHRPKSFVQYRIRREQAQAKINQLLAISKKSNKYKGTNNFFDEIQETKSNSKWTQSQIFSINIKFFSIWKKALSTISKETFTENTIG